HGERYPRGFVVCRDRCCETSLTGHFEKKIVVIRGTLLWRSRFALAAMLSALILIDDPVFSRFSGFHKISCVLFCEYTHHLLQACRNEERTRGWKSYTRCHNTMGEGCKLTSSSCVTLLLALVASLHGSRHISLIRKPYVGC